MGKKNHTKNHTSRKEQPFFLKRISISQEDKLEFSLFSNLISVSLQILMDASNMCAEI